MLFVYLEATFISILQSIHLLINTSQPLKQPKFIVIEGLDGSGKSTQLELLKEYLTKHGISFRHIHFPRLNEGVYGHLIAEFLRGDFGANDLVHPKLVALLFAGDRKDFARTIHQWLEEGHCVIADRYVYSNIAFQCAKLEEMSEKEQLKDWILDLEYKNFQIPMPDASLFLDVSTKAAAKALSEDDARSERHYLSGNKDIHESDLEFQGRVHQEYLNLVTSEDRFDVLRCVNAAGERLSPEATHQEIIRWLFEMQVLD